MPVAGLDRQAETDLTGPPAWRFDAWPIRSSLGAIHDVVRRVRCDAITIFKPSVGSCNARYAMLGTIGHLRLTAGAALNLRTLTDEWKRTIRPQLPGPSL